MTGDVKITIRNLEVLGGRLA